MVKLTFLGTGTSQGVPMIGCDCAVCRSADRHDKRLRTSALVETEGVRIVIDAGPDFRYQMLREDVRSIDAILFTHNHKDHTGGLDDVRAFNYFMDRAVDVYGEPYVLDTLRKDFDYAFVERKYPGAPEIVLHAIHGTAPFRVKGVEVVPVRGFHYKLPVLGFRIGCLCYITDMNRIEDDQIARIEGVDILVINALRHEKHLSHFTLDEALEVIGRVKPGRAYLTHMSHQFGKYADMKDRLPEGVYLAYDGLQVECGR